MLGCPKYVYAAECEITAEHPGRCLIHPSLTYSLYFQCTLRDPTVHRTYRRHGWMWMIYLLCPQSTPLFKNRHQQVDRQLMPSFASPRPPCQTILPFTHPQTLHRLPRQLHRSALPSWTFQPLQSSAAAQFFLIKRMAKSPSGLCRKWRQPAAHLI